MWKGFIRNKKAGTYGSGNPITSNDVLVVEKPIPEGFQKWGIQVEGGTIEYISADQVINLLGKGGTKITREGKEISIESSNLGRTPKVIQATSYDVVPEDFTDKVLIFGGGNITTQVNIASSSVTGLTYLDSPELIILTEDENKVTFVSSEPSVYAVTTSPDKLPESYPGGYCFITGLLGPVDAEVATDGAVHFSGDLNYNATNTCIQGTLTRTASFTLDATMNQKTIILNLTSDITVAIPSGLGKDFSCNLVSEDSSTFFAELVQGAGTTLKAPHGKKLLTDYTCNILKKTDQEVFNAQGELTV